MKISFYGSTREQKNKVIDLSSILSDIKEGRWEKEISSLRKHRSNKNESEANTLKSNLPAFTYSATFKQRRVLDEIDNYNGLIGLDYDHVNSVQELKSKLVKLPYTEIAFISPSGDGVKVFVRTNSTADNHKEVFNAVRAFYDDAVGEKSDAAVKDINRLCYVSWDPKLYLNEYPTPFVVDTSSDIDLKWVWDFTSNLTKFNEGSRNTYVFNFACNANRYGFDEMKTIDFASNYSENDFGRDEIERTISNVYKNYTHENAKAAIPAISAKTEIIDPFIPDEVYDNLPEPLRIATTHFKGRERDIFLTSALSVLSGGMHNVYGLYANEKVYPNLFSFVVAPPASGKGSMKYSGQLGDCYHHYLCLQSKEALKQYKIDKRVFDMKLRQSKGKDIESLEEPQEPQLNIFFLPADSSSAMMIKLLQDNEGRGCIIETEADTLTNTLKQDWGSYSDILRKGFQGETISKSRKSDFEYLTVDEPKFSLAMTGTPNQLDSLITSINDGLFSRFMFYKFQNEPVWKVTYTAERTRSNSDFFSDFSAQLCDKFKSNKTQRFVMSPAQGNELDNRFREVLAHNNSLYSDSVRGVTFRHGLMCYKICMTLTALRSDDDIIHCSDTDFKSAMTLIEVYLKHSINVLQKVEKKEGQYNVLETQLLKWIDENIEFKRVDIAEYSKSINIPDRSLSAILKKFINDGKIQKIKNGQYTKR